MSDSSNNHENVSESTSVEVASPTEQIQQTPTPAVADSAPVAAPSPKADLKTHIEEARKKAEASGATVDPGVNPDKPQGEGKPGEENSKGENQGEKPSFQANFKYKAFGKEKEVDDFWKPLIKDADSEKKVKEVFTRADAFDEMKNRYESASFEQQRTLTQFTALDRDVKRVTKFLNDGDYPNFFKALNIDNGTLLQHLQNEAEIAKLSPHQQQQYAQGVQQRAEQVMQQEQFEQMQSNYANQAVQARTMQLEMVLSRPDVERTASALDARMGQGAFRDLVTETAKSHWYSTKEDLPADKAVQMTLDRFGKLLGENPAPQAQAPAAQPQNQPPAQAPQGQSNVVMNQGKPVIPNVKGRGTSPVAKNFNSLADVRKEAKRLAALEAN